MAWWQDFFDDHYVEAWTAAGVFDHTDDQVEALVALLDLPDGARILDAACGFGRIAGRLRDRGFEVTGIDASARQLELAEKRNPGPRYVLGDMRAPPPGPYDAVVNIFSSFGYFDDRSDDLAALAAWHEVLRDGGQLVMELMHRDKVAAAFTRETPSEWPGGVEETQVVDWETGVITARITYRDIERTFRVRLYTATELVRELRGVGFSTVDVHGDLGGLTPVSPATRLVVHARR